MGKVWALVVVVGLCAGFLGWDWWGHRGTDSRVTGFPETRDLTALEPYVGRGERMTVVHFWATWCPPCMVEMPQVLAGLKDIPAGVQVVMVNLDDPLPGDFYGKWKIDAGTANPLWVNDPEQVMASAVLGKVMLPTTLVVAPSPTRILQQVDGPLSWEPLLKALK